MLYSDIKDFTYRYTMVFTNAQTLAFWSDAAQMAVPAATIPFLNAEGLTMVEDLADFEADDFKQLAANVRRPQGTEPDPNDPAGTRVRVVPAIVLGTRSIKRLKVAARAVRYYLMVGRPINASAMQWNPRLKNFELAWHSLLERKAETPPAVPGISKILRILPWTETFQDYLCQIIGKRNIPLSYVIRDDATVPAAIEAFEQSQPYSTQYKSIVEEMVERSAHTHALFKDDNAQVYHCLENATRSTIYAATIRPFSKKRRMEGKLGPHFSNSMLGMTSGRKRFMTRKSTFTIESGQALVILDLKSLFSVIVQVM